MMTSFQKITNLRNFLSGNDRNEIAYLFRNLVYLEKENQSAVDFIRVLSEAREGKLTSFRFWKKIRTLALTTDIHSNSGFISKLSEVSLFKFAEICQKNIEGMDLVSFNGLLVILGQIKKSIPDIFGNSSEFDD